MMVTPSRLRREGRNAFVPGHAGMDFNPYLKLTAWDAVSKARSWQDGWIEAKNAHEEGLKNQTPESVADQNGGTWGEHVDYSVEDWVDEVTQALTRKGYWEWVFARMEADGTNQGG